MSEGMKEKSEETKENESKKAHLETEIRKRRIINTALMYVGAALVSIGVFRLAIVEIFYDYWPSLLGVIIIVYSISNLPIRTSNQRFQDVDDNAKRSSINQEVDKIVKSIESQRAPQNVIYNIKSVSSPSSDSSKLIFKENSDAFTIYFYEIGRILQDKAELSDKKASILLDKATGYTRFGIWLFIVSIIVWQILSFAHGFQVQYIYGMISCSLLFVFIEVLSAWFLRQYRHFVDTSTYLIKVKSLFDRYMLTYMVSEKTSSDGEISRDYGALIALLSEDIKWPDQGLDEKGNIRLAKEALQTISQVANTVKSNK